MTLRALAARRQGILLERIERLCHASKNPFLVLLSSFGVSNRPILHLNQWSEFRGPPQWIDTNRGFTLMGRETHSAPDGALFRRIQLSGQRELALGIWLPTRIRIIQYDSAAQTEQARSREVRDTTLSVLHAAVNDVDDSVFEFHPPPGALLMRAFGPPVQIRAEGLDHLDNLARWIQNRSAPRSGDVSSFAPLAGVPFLVIIALCEYWRLRQARKKGR
jgi:hypothetical protein